MPTFDRRFLLGSAMSAIPPALLLCLLMGSPDLLTGAWQVSWLKPAFPKERRREEALDRVRESVRRRSEGRRAIARDMAEGRLPLLEAAARSRDLDRGSEDFAWDAFRRNLPADSDEERHCREVIGHLRSFQPLGPSPTEELALRLEDELREHLARGTLRLP